VCPRSRSATSCTVQKFASVEKMLLRSSLHGPRPPSLPRARPVFLSSHLLPVRLGAPSLWTTQANTKNCCEEYIGWLMSKVEPDRISTWTQSYRVFFGLGLNTFANERIFSRARTIAPARHPVTAIVSIGIKEIRPDSEFLDQFASQHHADNPTLDRPFSNTMTAFATICPKIGRFPASRPATRNQATPTFIGT
jgi:hypothetical protein